MKTLLLCIALVAAPVTAGAAQPLDDIRGIVISTPRAGQDWASPEMRKTMAGFPEVGANWVATHPYAGVSRETGEVRTFIDSTEYITHPIKWAKELNLGVAVKPHLAYWGQFSWRGEVGWGDDTEKWETFRKTYRTWILEQARLAGKAGADLFVVGTELRKTEGMTQWWRGLIAEIRKVFPGHLTYAANWDDYHRIKFWDALDSIGVQAYFPLSTAPSPTTTQLKKAWREPLADVRRVAKTYSKPILWTEIGYSNAADAAARPWESSRSRGESDLQMRLLQVGLEIAHENDDVLGLFLWKWFPTVRSSEPYDFVVQTQEHKALLRKMWHAPIKDSAPEAAK